MTRFLDVHVHPPVAEFLEGAFAPFLAGVNRDREEPVTAIDLDDLAEHYRSRDGRAVLLGWDAETATRRAPLTNRRVAEMVAAHPDVFLGFGSVDPHKGAAAVSGVHEAARLGLRGLSFHPPVQRFTPSDRLAYPVWEVAAGLGLPVLLHAGYTAVGAGEPGGGGIDLANADPLHVDRLAADFPDLTIVLAHASWPWSDLAVAVAMHKGNVILELSGWDPARLPASLVEAIAGPLRDRVVFGTDFPFSTPDRWIEGWERAGFPDEVTRAVLHDTAARLLGV